MSRRRRSTGRGRQGASRRRRSSRKSKSLRFRGGAARRTPAHRAGLPPPPVTALLVRQCPLVDGRGDLWFRVAPVSFLRCCCSSLAPWAPRGALMVGGSMPRVVDVPRPNPGPGPARTEESGASSESHGDAAVGGVTGSQVAVVISTTQTTPKSVTCQALKRQVTSRVARPRPADRAPTLLQRPCYSGPGAPATSRCCIVASMSCARRSVSCRKRTSSV